MEQNVKIRNAEIEDVDTIFSFISHLEETSFDFKQFRERYVANLSDDNCIYLVASSNHNVCIGFIGCQGHVVLHQEGWIYEIQEFYVARHFRGRGIGKTLFAALEEKLKEKGCTMLEVAANLNRADARRFYTKLGFTQTHIRFMKSF